VQRAEARLSEWDLAPNDVGAALELHTEVCNVIKGLVPTTRSSIASAAAQRARS
jgi:hypothetical protein